MKFQKGDISSRRLKLIGKKFGRLTVLKFFDVSNGNSRWVCKCICGKEVIVCGCDLKSSHTKSCGCLFLEAIRTHNLSKTLFYSKWEGMVRRCNNKKCHYYFNYGGRGIKVCKRWLKFENFMTDMYLSYFKHCEKYGVKNTTIERINNDGNYEPSNCKWATHKEQNRNMRSNKFYTYNNETLCLKDWAKKLNFNYDLLRGRIRDNWSFKRAVETPIRYRKS